MNCPRCQTVVLRDEELEANLLSLSCPQCRGHWVKGFQYWKWLEGHGPNLPETAASVPTPVVADSTSALICPDCRHILGRYQIGHDIPFALDHCAHCGGIWFDGGEWETLKARNLHDDAHAVFSDVWQAKLRHEAQAQEHERNLQTMLGEEDLAELRRIKSWLTSHPQQYAMYALLHPDHPL